MTDKNVTADMQIGKCGICCSYCPLFRSADCPGCSSLPSCQIRSCSIKKNLKSCFFCEEFPCKLFEQGFPWDLSEFSSSKNPPKEIVQWKPYSETYIALFKRFNQQKKNEDK